MSDSRGYQVKYSNKASKPVSGVIFAADDSSSVTEPCSAWAVLKDREVSLVIPTVASIGFQYFSNGRKCLIGPYSCEKDKSWVVTVEGEDKITLSPVQSVCDFTDEKTQEPSGNMYISIKCVVSDTVAGSWDSSGIDGKISLYKSDRSFLVKTFKPGEEVKLLESPPNLYFGLTTHNINSEDFFTNRKMFTPLAKIDQSYHETGLNIEVSDNPAGRPHVNINRL